MTSRKVISDNGKAMKSHGGILDSTFVFVSLFFLNRVTKSQGSLVCKSLGSLLYVLSSAICFMTPFAHGTGPGIHGPSLRRGVELLNDLGRKNIKGPRPWSITHNNIAAPFTFTLHNRPRTRRIHSYSILSNITRNGRLCRHSRFLFHIQH